MVYWETAHEQPSISESELEFARLWQGAAEDRVLPTPSTKVQGNARLATDGLAEELATLREQPGKDLAIGGAGLASTAMKLDLDRRVPGSSSTR